MKRIITLILAIVMLISVVSCGNTNASTTKPKFQGWLIEIGAPVDTFGVLEGQMCLDQDTYNLYQFTTDANGELNTEMLHEEYPVYEDIAVEKLGF